MQEGGLRPLATPLRGNSPKAIDRLGKLDAIVPRAYLFGRCIMSLFAVLTYFPRLIGFLITFPLRAFGLDFDWGIR